LPIIYGHGHGHDGGSGIVPILSDIGFQLRGGTSLNLFEGSKINYAVYLVNGPKVAEEVHVEDGEEEHGEEGEEEHDEEGGEEHNEDGDMHTELVFGNNFTDINSNKALGGRFGFLPIWNWEIGASLMFGDAGDDVDFLLYGFDTAFQYEGVLLLGEFIHLENDNIGGGEIEKNGFYLQGSYRIPDLVSIDNRGIQYAISRFEPVVRYGKIYQEGEDLSQWALGLNWWLYPSVPFKIAYEFNDGSADRFMIEWAYGF
jgi:hypothetical protein